MPGLFKTAEQFLIERGLGPEVAAISIHLLFIVGVVLLAFIADVVTQKFLVGALKTFAKKTRSSWDDKLIERNVVQRLTRLAPATVIYAFAPIMFHNLPFLEGLTTRVAVAYMLLVGVLVADALINAAADISETFRLLKGKPIKSYAQALKIILYVVGGILIITTLLDRSPVAFLTGLGAMTAVLLLVFKDPILGLVASIQIAAHNMVKVDDWIEMPKFGADGDVIDVSLTTIKVQNWDKTITTIPTYALISDSFKNWRGMSESGGRRIKRAVQIDMGTVRFCDQNLIDRFKKIHLLSEYINGKEEELKTYNMQHGVESDVVVNGRRMTNIGTFRAYLKQYLRHHPMVRQDMTFLVRHLPPSEKGLPIEIYVFSRDQVWANYEDIQADILDHILAALPHFDLSVYQSPSSTDLRSLSLASAN